MTVQATQRNGQLPLCTIDIVKHITAYNPSSAMVQVCKHWRAATLDVVIESWSDPQTSKRIKWLFQKDVRDIQAYHSSLFHVDECGYEELYQEISDIFFTIHGKLPSSFPYGRSKPRFLPLASILNDLEDQDLCAFWLTIKKKLPAHITLPSSDRHNQKLANRIRNWLIEHPKPLASIQSLLCLSINMRCLPEEILLLPNLTSLNISRNTHRHLVLPKQIHQLSLNNLRLAENKLSSIPNWIGICSKLQILDCSSNQISSLPQSLQDLSQLRELKLYDNNLLALPDWFDKFPHLKHIDVSNNKLTAIPQSLTFHSQNPWISIQHNAITSIPMIQAHHLRKRLSWYGNPLDERTLDVLNPPTHSFIQKICNWISSLC